MKNTSKTFVFDNKDKIEELLSYKFSYTEIYNTFVESPNLQTPKFSLRTFQHTMKKIYSGKEMNISLDENKPNEVNKIKQSKEKNSSAENPREKSGNSKIKNFKQPKKRKFEYDPTEDLNTDDLF